MNRRPTILMAPLSLWFALTLNAPGNAQSLVESGLQSTPTLRVFVYSFPGLPRVVLQGAESEAVRILRPVPIQWSWIDCTGRVMPASCQSPQVPTDLVIRLTRKALPQVSVRTLGIAGSSAEYATAFLFYDRVLALRTQTHLLPVMLGRVLAHEITHLLLPQEEHAELGLMRGHWSAEDLQKTSTACLGLSIRSIRLMQGEALRRVLATHRAGNSEETDHSVQGRRRAETEVVKCDRETFGPSQVPSLEIRRNRSKDLSQGTGERLRWSRQNLTGRSRPTQVDPLGAFPPGFSFLEP